MPPSQLQHKQTKRHGMPCSVCAVDCTITVNDSLDLLAEFMGVKEEVARLTSKVGALACC
jgi:hypothetical protein